MNDLMPVLLKDTYSLSQLKHRLRILKTNLLKSFFGGQAESIPPADLNWLKSLPSPFYTNFTKDNVYKIFSLSIYPTTDPFSIKKSNIIKTSCFNFVVFFIS